MAEIARPVDIKRDSRKTAPLGLTSRGSFGLLDHDFQRKW